MQKPASIDPAFESATDVARTNGRNILYVIGSLELGGAERQLVLITPKLRALGWRPTIYCLSHRGAQADQVLQAGVEVLEPPFQWARKIPFTKALQFLTNFPKLLAIMLLRRPAITHFFLPGAYVVGAPLALMARIPVLIMSRRSLNVYRQRWPRMHKVELWLHKRMTAILGNSDRVVRQLLELEGCPAEKTHLIYNGIALEGYGNWTKRSDTRAALQIEDTTFVAVLVANLIAYKGHADLIAALAKICEALPRPWAVLCVGRDDGLLAALTERTFELGLSEHVRFLGARTDVPDLLAAADLGLLCSHQEGFSNAILEGMAAGLPMVVTDVGGNAEAVVDGETGLVVPAKDPAALGAAILELARDPDRAKAMGAAGRRRAEEQFSMERCVAEYDALYRRLTDTGRC
ncbi:MAG: glycosyltransferase [Methyloligellaceae bacterium]